MSSARSNGQFKIWKVYNDYDQGGKDLGTRILQFEASIVYSIPVDPGKLRGEGVFL